jgi:hypothetical protein
MLADNSDPAGLCTYLVSAVIMVVSVGIALFMALEDARADRSRTQSRVIAGSEATTTKSP